MMCLLLIFCVLIGILLLQKRPIDAEIENTAAVCLFEQHQQVIKEQRLFIEELKKEIEKKDQALALIKHVFPATIGTTH